MKTRILFLLPLCFAATLIGVPKGVSAQKERASPTAPSSTAGVRQHTDLEALNQSIKDLDNHVNRLVDEVKQFKLGMTEVTTLWRLMLNEQRQAWSEQQLSSTLSQLADIDAQETAIRSRLKNLDQEYIATGSAFVTQDQARTQIRQQLEAQLTQLAARRRTLSEQERRFREQGNQLRQRGEGIRREMEAFERKRESGTEGRHDKE